jgi:hypothetical protein
LRWAASKNLEECGLESRMSVHPRRRLCSERLAFNTRNTFAVGCSQGRCQGEFPRGPIHQVALRISAGDPWPADHTTLHRDRPVQGHDQVGPVQDPRYGYPTTSRQGVSGSVGVCVGWVALRGATALGVSLWYRSRSRCMVSSRGTDLLWGSTRV